MLCLVRWKADEKESIVLAELSDGERAELDQILILAVANGPLKSSSIKEIDVKSMENVLAILSEEVDDDEDDVTPPPVREATR